VRKKRIPIAAAKRIAEEYGYDQVMIYARACGDDGGEHMTTYGVTKEHCGAMAQIARFLQVKIMGWIIKEKPNERVAFASEDLAE
jgi:hypothetical protein